MKRIIVLLITILLPTVVYAYSSDEIITDEYVYSSLEGANKQLSNTFVYRDADFTRSSFEGSKSLETLSIQVAAASLSRWGMNEDIYEADYTYNDYNIKKMLGQMKFNDIKSNAYYNAEKKPNSVGVIIGSKKIIQDDKEYTLLAIIPRSAGYRLEWSGNFNIGGGDIHTGFKAARDEILRFTKKYISDNNITGDLKVWTTGYSRGAAISNSVAGFFAGGGISYFGSSVSLTPEDVYCYTIGTPSSVKDGVSKNIELSVAGKRDDSVHEKDTEGSVYTYTGGGTLDLSSNDYKGIRSIIFKDDAFALLPPSVWGFTRYGEVIDADEGLLSEEEAIKDLKTISDYGYNSYTTDGVINKFYKKSFDLPNAAAKNEEEIDKLTFVQSRFDALTSMIHDNADFEENYEMALRYAIGTYGMASSMIDTESASGTTTPLLYTFLAYESEILINDPSYGITGETYEEKEEKAVTIIFEDIIKEYIDSNFDADTITFDEFIELIAKYLTEHEDDPIMDTVAKTFTEQVPSDYSYLLNMIFGSFVKDADTISTEEATKKFLKACYLGPEEDTSTYGLYTAKQTRGFLYGILTIPLGMSETADYTELIEFLNDETKSIPQYDSDSSDPLPDEKTFKEFISVYLKTVKKDLIVDEDNSENNQVITYNTLGELADVRLQGLLDELIYNGVIEKCEPIYGFEFKLDLIEQYIGLRNNITTVRKVLSRFFFYNEDGFNVIKSINNTLTVVDNFTLIAVPHFEDLYLAYSRNSSRYTEEYYLIKGDEQTINVARNNPLQVVFNFNHYEFEDRGKVYIDGVELSKDKYTVSKGSTIITLNRDYLSTLSLGNHVLTAEIDDHQIDAEFTLKYQKNPKTGDSIINYLMILILSLITLYSFKKKLYN